MRTGWELKKLGEVCEIINGSTPLRTNKDYWENGTFPWFTIDDIREQGRIITKTKQKVTQAALTKLRILPINTVLICCTASVGEFALAKIELTSNQQFNGLVIKKEVELSPEFLFYFSSTLKEKLLGLSGKTTIDFIAISKLKTIEIPLPPLPEQQRIVALLDEAFAAIAKAKANAEQNLKNAKELFESYLQGVFENKGEGWEEKSLEELADESCTLSYGIVQPGEEFENGLPVIRPTDLTSRYIKVEGLKRIDPKLADGYKRTKLIGDELLLCVRGITGVVSIATPELKNANVTRGIVPVRFNSKFINQEFGYYLLISNYVQKQIRAKTYGAALMQINIGDLRKILTPYPSIKEQQSIVRQLDALRAETQRLAAVYQQKLADLEELKKSILQKAFAGELKTEVEVRL
jgi:type I restriction enzyme S subunit